MNVGYPSSLHFKFWLRTGLLSLPERPPKKQTKSLFLTMECQPFDATTEQTMEELPQQSTEQDNNATMEEDGACTSAEMRKLQCKEEFLAKFQPNQVCPSPAKLCSAITECCNH